jgi:hypothetical protein
MIQYAAPFEIFPPAVITGYPLEPVIGLAEGETRWGMTAVFGAFRAAKYATWTRRFVSCAFASRVECWFATKEILKGA